MVHIVRDWIHTYIHTPEPVEDGIKMCSIKFTTIIYIFTKALHSSYVLKKVIRCVLTGRKFFVQHIIQKNSSFFFWFLYLLYSGKRVWLAVYTCSVWCPIWLKYYEWQIIWIGGGNKKYLYNFSFHYSKLSVQTFRFVGISIRGERILILVISVGNFFLMPQVKE